MWGRATFIIVSTYLEKDEIEKLFNSKVWGGDTLPLVSRMLYYELYISRMLMEANSLHFSFEEGFEEVSRISSNQIRLIHSNPAFFENLHEEIRGVVLDSTLRTKFLIEGNEGLSSIAYFTIIVNSLHFVEQISLLEHSEKTMLHRSVVEDGIRRNAQALKLLRLSGKMYENTFKIIMIMSGLIATRKIVVKQNKKYKTYFYLKLNIVYSASFIDRLVIVSSRVPFRRLSKYFIGASHLTLTKVMRKSNFQMDENRISTDALQALGERGLKIDPKLWPLVRDTISAMYRLKYELRGGESLSLLLEDMILNKEILEEGKETLGDNQDEEGPEPHTSKIELLEEYKRDIQRFYYLIVGEKAIEWSGVFYMAYYYDFRGRMYSTSAIDPMFLKVMRPMFMLEGEWGVRVEKSAYYRKILELSPKLEEHEAYIHNDRDRYLTTIVLMEVGKLNKNKHVGDGGLSLKTLVSEGIKELRLRTVEEVEDLVYVKSLESYLLRFQKDGIWGDITIIRDSTASSLQHWTTLLRIREPESLKLFNLRGDEWFDSYTVIIDLFKKEYAESIYMSGERTSTILNRKVLKRMIMTVNYNAGLRTSTKYTKEEMGEKNWSNEDFEELIKDFHDFILNKLFTLLYKDNKDSFLEKMNYRFKCGKEEFLLNYLVIGKQEKEEIKIRDLRWIFVRNRLGLTINKNKSDRALPANVIQACDANLARYLVQNVKCFSIHDSFGVSIYDVGSLMDLTNSYFDESIPDRGYALFILI